MQATQRINITPQLLTQAQNLVVYGNEAGTGTAVPPGLQVNQVTVIDAGNNNVRITAAYPYQPLFGPQLADLSGWDHQLDVHDEHRRHDESAMSRRNQRGTTTVEFAICGSVVIMVILGGLEMSRAMFMLSVLKEHPARSARGRRMSRQRSRDRQATTFANPPGLTPQNVTVEYLDQAGAAIGNPAGNFEPSSMSACGSSTIRSSSSFPSSTVSSRLPSSR